MKQPVYGKRIRFKKHFVEFAEWYFKHIKKYDTLGNLLKYIKENNLARGGVGCLNVENMDNRWLGTILTHCSSKKTFKHKRYYENDTYKFTLWTLKGNKLPKQKGNKWTLEEKNYFKTCENLSNSQISILFHKKGWDRTENAIRCYRGRMNILERQEKLKAEMGAK